MKKIDTYIIKKFLGTYFFSIVLILSIAVVFDLTEKMDNFFEEMKKNNVELAQMAGGKAGYAEAFWQHLGGGFQKEGLLQQELKDYIIYPKN